MATNATGSLQAVVEHLRLDCRDFLWDTELCSGPAWQSKIPYSCGGYSDLHYDRRSFVGLFGVLKSSHRLVFGMYYLILYVFVPVIFLWWCFTCFRLAWKWLSAHRGWLSKAVMTNLKCVCGSFTARGYFQDIDEPLRREMIEIVHQQRRDLFLKVTAATAVILPAVCLWNVIQAQPWRYMALCEDDSFLQSSKGCDHRLDPIDLLGRQQTYVAQTIGTGLFLCMCLFASSFPGCVGTVFMASTHATIIFGIAWHRIDAMNSRELEMHWSFFVHLRLAAGLCFGSIPETVILNAMLFLLEYVLTDGLHAPSFHRHCRENLMYCLFIFACTVSYERAKLQQVKHLVTGHASWRRAHTAKDILNMMCDAVVELCNFAVSQPCPKLATLTLRGGSAQLKDTPFLELVCDADRERCQIALTSTVEVSRTVHVDLRESLGGKVPVQLFITSVPTLSGTREHVIGIREENEATNDTVSRTLEARQKRQVPSLANDFEILPRSSATAGTPNSDTSGEAEVDIEQLSSGCASVFDYLKASPSAYQSNALLWLAKDDSLTIVGYSLPFLHYFGPSFSALAKDFSDWIAPECRNAFAEWLDGCLDADADSHAIFPRLCLYPPHLCKSVKILCEVKFLPVTEEDPEWAFVFDDISEDEEVQVPTVLVIDKVAYKWRMSRRSERAVLPSHGMNQIEVRSEGDIPDLLHL
eukprot:TRINITY_DN34800_c0_g2_i1.p1 TRINITY_DN34800_c0_g2~~TRINITY_DN34800_c0_g2_i1.p1  ORF type:complete len:697 (-),score=91.04 TRINITY_DN34800_c0_g2_i1:165-2255(-)